MKKKRLSIIFIAFFIVFFILLTRLFYLTVIKGDVYRKFSDNNRIREIDFNASRGIIYDRNGNKLADNKPSYNLQAYSDRFYEVDAKIRNHEMANLVGILEEDGEKYLKDYIFEIYHFKYDREDKYFTNKLTPNEKVIQIIKKNNLLKEILSKSYSINKDIKFYPIKRMFNYLDYRGKNLPIELEINDSVKLKYIDTKDDSINKNVSPLDYIISEVKDDTTFIEYLISHPISRKIIYDVLKEHSIQEDLVLSDLEYSFDLDYIEHKSALSLYSNKVTLNSSAKSDFINLVKENALKKLLTTAYKKDNGVVIPVSILINKLEINKVDTGIKYELNESDNTVEIKYKDENKYETTTIKPLDALIDIANKNNIIDDFIVDEDIKYFAQSALFSTGIYPRIYIGVWKYSYLSDKDDALGSNKNKKVEDLFKEYKDDYKITNSNVYISYALLSIYGEIDSQGYFAYKPFSIAKNLSKNSVIKIQERIPKNLGLEISIQPVRDYPNKKLAAHVLGYLGNISDPKEIKKFDDYKKYDPNDKVGKTGLEESYEKTLKGIKGKRLVYTNVYGQTTDVIEETPPIPGNNLYTTIDIRLQKDMDRIIAGVLKAMKKGTSYNSYLGERYLVPAPRANVAASVVMDVKTGEILAMASYPSYDPNLFVNGISDYDWGKLSKVEEKDVYAPRPIMNTLFQALTPGSTFKTVMALGALEKGLDPEDPIYSTGYVDVGNDRFYELIYSLYGEQWGNINLYDALKVSSNYYFYVLGLGYNPNLKGDNNIKVSIDDINKITKQLGLQDPTGVEINIPYESSGSHPSLETKINYIKDSLSNELDVSLPKYIKKGIKLTEDKIKRDKKTILKWVDTNGKMGRSELINNLEKMGYNADVIVDGENEGLADKIKYTYINQAYWTESDAVNMSIGQGQNAYTPLQLVQLASIFANNGKIVKPTLIKEIKSFDNKSIFVNSPKIRDTGIDAKYFKIVKEGMRRSSGNAGYRYLFPLEMGGKTGTAELSAFDPVTGKRIQGGLEIMFAPYDKPEIAAVTYMINAGGSYNAKAVNTELAYSYFKNIKKDPRFIDK